MRHAHAALALTLLTATLALAEPDSFDLGGGRTKVSSISGEVVVNSYATVTGPLAPGDMQIPVDGLRRDTSNSSFVGGDLVMILQTTGIVPSVQEGQSTPVDLGGSDVGQWEFARLDEDTSSSLLKLSAPLVHAYAGNVTQVIRVPEYENLAIDENSRIVAIPWDGQSGGVIAFLVQGALTVNGAISADGVGFQGGLYEQSSNICPALSDAQKGEGVDPTRYGSASGRGRNNVANGAGGGSCFLAGGGGGGNAGSGGKGGDNSASKGGLGGAALIHSMLERLTLGGGGGSGHGGVSPISSQSSSGRGGGIIFIRADSLHIGNSGSGIISASGLGGYSDTSTSVGGGGGGAGGTILVRLRETLTCDNSGSPFFLAHGGVGGAVTSDTFTPGAGGGGGGGQVVYQSSNSSSSPASCDFSNVDTMVSGGGAGSGGAGGVSQGSSGLVSVPTGSFPLLHQPVVTNPTGSTNNRKPQISGATSSSDPIGIQVVIYLNGVEEGRTYSNNDAGRQFSFPVARNLADGSYSVQAAVTYQGVQSPKSVAVSFNVDGTKPQPPTIETLGTRNASQGMLVGTPDLVGNSLSLVVSGKTEVGSTVTVEQREGTNVISQGSAVGGADGNWFVNLDQSPSVEKSYSLKVVATDTAQNQSDSTVLGFNLDTKAPTPVPTITKIGGQPVGSSTVLVNTKWPQLEGESEPNSRVSLVLSWTDAAGNHHLDLEATADASQHWSVVAPDLLDGVTDTVEITAHDLAGNSSAGTTRAFKVDATAPAKPAITKIGRPPERTPSQGMLVGQPNLEIDGSLLVSGTAEPGSSISAQQLGPDGAITTTPVATATTIVDSTGEWTVYLSQPANVEASYTLEVTATDQASNVSGVSTLGFRLDTKTPDMPSGLRVAGRVPAADCSSSSLPLINSGLPLIEGRAEPMGRISVILQDSAGHQHVQPDTLTNGLPNGLGSWSVLVAEPQAGLPDETYTLTAKVTDQAGNESVLATVCFAVDTTKPGAPVVTTLGAETMPANGVRIGPNDLTSGALGISGQAEVGSKVELKLIPLDPNQQIRETEAGATDGTWSDGWQGLPSGNYAVEARAIDKADNMGDPKTIFFELDLAPPALTIAVHPDKLVTTLDAIFAFSSSEPSTEFECSVDGASTPSSCSNPYRFSVDGPGPHTIKVWGIDELGNRTDDTDAPEYEWTVDSALPIANIEHPDSVPHGGASTKQTSIAFELQANKEELRIDCRLDGTAQDGGVQDGGVPDNCVEEDGGVQDETWEKGCGCPLSTPDSGICIRSYSGLSDNAHVFEVRAHSCTTGVTTPESLWRKNEWVVDTHSPVIVVTRPPPEWPPSNSVTVGFIAQGEAQTPNFGCALELDGGIVSNTPCQYSEVTSSSTFPNLKDGSYKLTITATDKAGNPQVAPQMVSWNVDTRPPGPPSIALPSENQNYGKATLVTVSGTSEPSSTISLYLDDEANARTTVSADRDTGMWEASLGDSQGLGDGNHTLMGMARDRAGNPSALSKATGFVVDTKAPEVDIVEGPDERMQTTSATFSFAVDESGASLECSLDAGEFSACSMEMTYTDLSDGPHSLYVRATDAAGNVGPTASRNWKVFLSGEAHVNGGGMGCASAWSENPVSWLLGLLGVLLASRCRTLTRGGTGRS